ncbi:MAG TPA: SRPBCC domain-containing protein [Bacteroidia bacterium]|nr:SRPBCC domain-containing protein [Bacteroidia bacterium]
MNIGKTTKTKSAFRMEYSVTISITANPDKIWKLLTDAAGYTRWNSTIKSLEGNISKGNKIKLRAKLDEKRVFTLTVAEMEPMKKMVWKSGAAPMFKGVRTYTLTPNPDGTTDFTMAEVFTGIMLPMIAGSLPDFSQAFEQFAADLKRAAE